MSLKLVCRSETMPRADTTDVNFKEVSMGIVGLLRGSSRFAVVLALCVSTTGCLTMKSYVDPTLPVMSSTELPKVRQPQPTTVLFEFKTKGNSNSRATSAMSGRVVAAVAQSGMFG